MYKKIQELEQASCDLKEAHDYTEALLKGRYHEAARHTWSGIPRPQEDTYIFDALVIALVLTLSRAHKYVKECLESEEDHYLAGMIRCFRNKYFAHSDEAVFPHVFGPGSHERRRPAWNENHTKHARILIEKSIRRVEEIKEKTLELA